VNKLLVAAAALVALAAIAAFVIVQRQPNTYYPYLPTKRADAYQRLRPLGFNCELDTRIGALGSGSNFGIQLPGVVAAIPDFEVGRCRNRFEGDFDVSFVGDDRAHVYAIDATSLGPVTVRTRKRLAHAVYLAAASHGLSPELESWLTTVDKIEAEKKTDRATATLVDTGPTSRRISITASDGEAVARIPFRGQPAPIAPERLAREFAPTFRLHKDEAFRPLSLDELPAVADLCKKRRGGSVVPGSCHRFTTLPARLPCRSQPCSLEWVLNVRGADEQHPSGYTAVEEGIREKGSRPRVYFHVVRVGRHRIVVQYWLYYLFNNFANKHEGDWETVQVDLVRWRQANQVAAMRWFASAHSGGEVRTCESTEDCHHPTIYVAEGSHANYFDRGSKKVSELCNESGRCFNIVVRRDHAQGNGERLTPDRYDLVPLERPAYSGRYGRYNFHLGPGDHDGPGDPRRRTEWLDDPLDSFVKAPGQEPNARHWYVIDLG
jgi:hypothetical protein